MHQDHLHQHYKSQTFYHWGILLPFPTLILTSNIFKRLSPLKWVKEGEAGVFIFFTDQLYTWNENPTPNPLPALREGAKMYLI
jgi:hypothetical protein